MPLIPDRVFKQPKLLGDDSQILGIPAKDWDRVFLGDMEKELQRLRASMPDGESPIPADDQSTA